MEWALILILRQPALARVVGWVLFSIASGAIGLGLRLGRALNRAMRAFDRAGVAQDLTVAQLYPNWPTWWIPESAAGFAAWLVVGGFGAWLAITAKILQKRYS